MRIRGLALALFALGALFSALACSSQSSQPPVLGACTSDAGKCGANVGGGGGGSGSGSGGSSSEGGTGACGLASNASQCDECVGEHCCGEVGSCENDTTCNALLECISMCGGGSTCTTKCQSTYPGAASLYSQLTNCENTNCDICDEGGVGDPCAATVTCVTGLTCMGQWCTKTCGDDSACAGIGPNDGNYTGQANACRHFVNGNYCVPGCTADTDCMYFAGTACIVTTNLAGANVSVCANAVDGGY